MSCALPLSLSPLVRLLYSTEPACHPFRSLDRPFFLWGDSLCLHCAALSWQRRRRPSRFTEGSFSSWLCTPPAALHLFGYRDSAWVTLHLHVVAVNCCNFLSWTPPAHNCIPPLFLSFPVQFRASLLLFILRLSSSFWGIASIVFAFLPTLLTYFMARSIMLFLSSFKWVFGVTEGWNLYIHTYMGVILVSPFQQQISKISDAISGNDTLKHFNIF